jgi:hypothetical protein
MTCGEEGRSFEIFFVSDDWFWRLFSPRAAVQRVAELNAVVKTLSYPVNFR